MGKEIQHRKAARRFLKHVLLSDLQLKHQCISLGEVLTQTKTAVHKFPTSLNLYDFQNTLLKHGVGRHMLELELFPALQMKMWRNVHINLFASGKCVITGIKRRLDAYEVINDLYTYIYAL